MHFLDDDDTVPDRHYAVVAETFDRNPGIGVVFGVLRPFCTFSDIPARRRQQERQLRDVRNWRVKVARFPWLYRQIGARLQLPVVTQWLYRQHAMFGQEMFLCSGGIIRHRHVLELGGFPDIRITEDYCFYGDAIRRFGALFLPTEAAGYGVGDPHALWNPLELNEAASAAHTNEVSQALGARQRKLRDEMGHLKFYARKITFRILEVVLRRGLIPVLDRRGYFTNLYRLTDPDCCTRKCASEKAAWGRRHSNLSL